MVMKMPPFHRRIIEAGLGICEEYRLFLAGGYAMKAHGLVERPSQDIDFAMGLPRPLEEITAQVARAYEALGFIVRTTEGNERFARLLISDAAAGESCEVDLMKVTLQVRPVQVDAWPVVGFEDAIGLKMRAVHDRGIARDLIDIASLAGEYGFRRLEWLGRCHEDEFSLERLVDRLEGSELRDDSEFEQYGLGEEEIRRVRRFAVEWAQDINMRLLEEAGPEND